MEMGHRDDNSPCGSMMTARVPKSGWMYYCRYISAGKTPAELSAGDPRDACRAEATPPREWLRP